MKESVVHMHLDLPKENVGKVAQKPRILLVDDDPLFLAEIKRLAKANQFDVIDYSSVKEIYWNLSENHFDVGIIDYGLGMVTGVQLARFLERSIPKFPMILVSAKERIEKSDGWPRCIEDAVSKSVGPHEILSIALKLTRKSP